MSYLDRREDAMIPNAKMRQLAELKTTAGTASAPVYMLDRGRKGGWYLLSGYICSVFPHAVCAVTAVSFVRIIRTEVLDVKPT
jgi:hypothetical protein